MMIDITVSTIILLYLILVFLSVVFLIVVKSPRRYYKHKELFSQYNGKRKTMVFINEKKKHSVATTTTKLKKKQKK
jgi:hypothetical protein